MKYIFNEDFDKSIEERILEINNVSKSDIDVSNFEIDYDLDILIDFKEKLLSRKDKRFFIVGDYDCDGICATTIMTKLFNDIGIKSNYYIPSRIKEGYGISNRIIDTAKENGFDCLLCVDNGIVANEQMIYAKKLGLDTFVIDHHQYQDKPVCDGFLHPNIFPDKYKDMCAGGLCALLSNSFRLDDFTTTLGGLATIGDMVSIFNYNRYIAKKMLENVIKGVVKPINLLLGKCDITYDNIQYSVIPKINAVSRLDNLMNVNYVVKFLLSEGQESFEYYDKIEIINNARKDYSNQMGDKAELYMNDDNSILIIKDKEFKEGLCGLLANRLVGKYRKPVIIFSEVDGMLKGSGRSVKGTNIYEYLKNIDYLFDTFGGHELAVGLSLKSDKYNDLIKYVDEHPLYFNEQIVETLLLDPDCIDTKILDDINELKPFGTGFAAPLFSFKDLKYTSYSIVSNRFPKYDINDNLSAISFNPNYVDVKFDYMIGKLTKDKYNPNKISFLIEDLV